MISSKYDFDCECSEWVSEGAASVVRADDTGLYQISAVVWKIYTKGENILAELFILKIVGTDSKSHVDWQPSMPFKLY